MIDALCAVPIDRDAALKEADHLLRQGKLDGAIEAYVRLIEDRLVRAQAGSPGQ